MGYIQSLQASAHIDWTAMYPDANREALYMMDKLLTFNPSRRLTVEAALMDPYMSQYYEPSDEPIADEPFSFEQELDDLPKEKLKELIFETIKGFQSVAP